VPFGTARLRISLNAGLSISDLDHFVETVVAMRETVVR
jgi:7-keto-8-aminopelargonate synthetase-like enzyme